MTGRRYYDSELLSFVIILRDDTLISLPAHSHLTQVSRNLSIASLTAGVGGPNGTGLSPIVIFLWTVTCKEHVMLSRLICLAQV